MAPAQPHSPRLAAGWQALEKNELAAAEAAARNVLAQDPQDIESQRLLGASLLFQDRFQEALAPLLLAHQRGPARGTGHRLGYCYLALGDFGSAVQVLEREVQAYPDLVNARTALGVALVQLSRREEALPVFLEAARLDPGSAEAHTNAGNLLAELGRYDEALVYLRRAVAARPGLADLHFNLGIALQKLKRHDEAIESLQAALDIAPRMPYALGHRVWNELASCRWAALEDGVGELRRQVREQGIPAAPFTLVGATDDAQAQRRCAELHVRASLPAPPPQWRGERYRHGRIRVAYLSADFCEHATAYLAAGLFERHDRSAFETVAVSYGPDDGSPMRARLARAFDRFLDVRSFDDAHVARLLREMEIDIAVDLKGHTTDARFGILAHRPAPVQVAWLGYPGTCGAGFIDYVLADRFVLPEAEQRHWTEKVVYLPECYQVNDATRAISERVPSRAAAGLPEAGFVFCCFNNSYKVRSPLFEAWMRLLGEVPGSVLWLLEDNAAARRNLEREAHTRGVETSRLVFGSRLPHAEHLARHRLADLFLDTLPFNAHTGASDALWAGLPLLTCAGSTFAGRVAGSLLHAVGLPELVTESLSDYEALALRLAREPRRLAQLRERLAAARGTAPLFDTDRFRRHLEAAYRDMLRARAPA